MKLNTLREQKGFTLIELMVAVSLMVVVLTLGYITFNAVYNSYQQAEQAYIEQQAVRQSVAWVDKMLVSSFQACIYQEIPTKKPEKEEIYLYATPEGIFHQTKDDPDPVRLTDAPLNTTFTIKEADGTTLTDALRYTISGVGTPTPYEISSVVYFPNMRGDADVNAPKGTVLPDTVPTGTALVFSPANGNLDALLNTDLSTRCFIATAAYGDFNQRPVQLLRRFRDEVLLPTQVGRGFVETYYRLSPPIADVIAQSGALAAVTRVLLLPLELVALLILAPQFLLLLLWLVPLLLGYRLYKKRRL